VIYISLDPFKKHSSVKGHATDTDVEQAVTTWLQTLDTDFFCDEIQALVPQWVKCLSWLLCGGLMCTICYTCTMYTLMLE